MKFALINPHWTFEGSIYFGCREAHLPLEFGYTRLLLEERGHDVLMLNAHMDGLSDDQLLREVESFKADVVVLTTANSYLFWRCAQPELRIPIVLTDELRQLSNFIIAVGPHASTTPRATLNKLKVDAVVLGECEEIIPLFADSMRDLHFIPCIAYRENGEVRIQGTPRSANMTLLPSLKWDQRTLKRHSHHHHRFDAPAERPGAEMEVSRGCPYHCTFYAKDDFRNNYRKRPHDRILPELDGLLDQGVEYIYFIDEIFLPDQNLLKSFANRDFLFGIQTRIDLWSEEMLELLGRAGCVSVEAGVESLTQEDRAFLDKKCRLSTQEITDKLIFAKQHIRFVQANLLESQAEDPDEVEDWRQYLSKYSVLANEPAPMFPYPGSPEYTKLWGIPDDYAWERAQNYYLKQFDQFSNIRGDRYLCRS